VILVLPTAPGKFNFMKMNGEIQNKIRLLIADDHRVLLDGLVSLLKTEENFIIAGIAEDGNKVVELIKQNDYDVCLLDISMPGIDGMEAAKWIRKNKPGIKIIILTTHDEEEIIAEMINMGVAGYLLKTSTRHELVEAINKVMRGKLYFSNEVNDALMKGYAKELDKKKNTAPTVKLTHREKQIVQLLAKEYTNDRIASELSISYRTVETHRKNMMQKTNAHNLAGLLKFAYSSGLIQ
jgi:DNA-binding NarL/FixJ family response regulator